MGTQVIPENPFHIVPAGGQCITKPQRSWNNGDSGTYVFSIPYNSEKPFSYLNIHLRPLHTLTKGWAAAIYGHAVKGVVMGDQYYVGDLGPEKMSSFIQISQTGQNTTYITKRTTCITIYITILPESEVKGVVRDCKLGKQKTGPFTQLN